VLTGLTGFTILLFIAIAVALIILGIGNELAPKGDKTPGKIALYACGEDLPFMRVRVNVENFFIYAVYFMIFDILGFVMATTLSRPDNLLIPLAYAGTSLISIVILTMKWRQ
jgi:NADH:ubiquinone oxidoreductase subunit 3 (subunit A)